MIKKLELHLLVDIILFKIELEHIQISVPKIGTPMLKTACISVYYFNTLSTAEKLLVRLRVTNKCNKLRSNFSHGKSCYYFKRLLSIKIK